MSPEIIHRKLSNMINYLEDLLPYQNVSYETFYSDHYKIERLIELLVMTASDIAFHLLSQQKEPPPASYRAAFIRLGELEILDTETSQNLALGAGLRNILVHDYEEIDYQLLHKSILLIIRDIRRFVDIISNNT
jgi:uncharacterized protein YutE (UPF0331/DUF86 family)